MHKISKAQLARLTIRSVHYYIEGKTLKQLVEDYGEDSWIDVEYDYGDSHVTLVSERLETDDEYNSRIAEIKAVMAAESERKQLTKAQADAKERKLYEKLKLKYGE